MTDIACITQFKITLAKKRLHVIYPIPHNVNDLFIECPHLVGNLSFLCVSVFRFCFKINMKLLIYLYLLVLNIHDKYFKICKLY